MQEPETPEDDDDLLEQNPKREDPIDPTPLDEPDNPPATPLR